MVDDEIDPDPSDYINETEPRKTEFVKNEPPPLIPRKTKAQIWEDTVIQFIKLHFFFLYKKFKISILFHIYLFLVVSVVLR